MEKAGEKTITFQPVRTPDDIVALAALAKEIWNECFVGILSQAQINYMVEKFQSAPALATQIMQNGYEYYLVLGAKGPMGYVGVRPQDGKLLLSKIYFLPQYRGTGAAQNTLDFVEDLARQRGCGTVWLTVNRHNARAMAAYRKRGFETVRTQVADIGGGYVMDDFVMEKPLG